MGDTHLLSPTEKLHPDTSTVSMATQAASLALVVSLLWPGHGVSGQSVVQNISASIPNGVLNPAEIDWPFIFNSLISPKGLVTQFALELETQTIFTLGWVVVSVLWQILVINNVAGLQALLLPLSFLLSTNAIANTVVRSLFDSVRSLVSRLVITIFVFGFEDTMSGIIANADPFSIGDFLFNPTILLITVGRFFAAITFFFIAIGPIFYFATNIYPNIRPPTETTRLLAEESGDYSYYDYGDYAGGYDGGYDGGYYAGVEAAEDWQSVALMRSHHLGPLLTRTLASAAQNITFK